MSAPTAPSNPLSSVLDVAESALAVRHVATTDLWGPSPRCTAADACHEMVQRGFDAAPVDERPILRYVTTDLLRNEPRFVDEVAQPIAAPELLTSDLGLADGIAALRNQPFRFVLSGQHVTGIFTWSDLQKPPVSMVVLAMILAAEPALDVLIEEEFPDWEDQLGPQAREKIADIYADRLRTNTEVTRSACMQVDHRLALIGKSNRLREALGSSSGKAWRRWEKRLKVLRNILAHGGNVLDAEPTPADAVDLIAAVRLFAEAAWRDASRS